MHQVAKEKLPESHETLTCPFCLNQCIIGEPGKTRCLLCDATFEIAEGDECVTGDAAMIRLPAVGFICASCGRIQAGQGQNCLCCGAEITASAQ